MIIGCSIGLITVFASSFITNYWAFLIVYGCGFGITNGISVIIIILMYLYSISFLSIMAGDTTQTTKDSSQALS